MSQEISLDLLRKFDPLALSPLSKDRVVYYFFKRTMDLIVTISALVLLLLRT